MADSNLKMATPNLVPLIKLEILQGITPMNVLFFSSLSALFLKKFGY